jgi:hypothetical protein
VVSKDPQMSKRTTAGLRKHLDLTITQQLEILRRPENGENRNVVMAS